MNDQLSAVSSQEPGFLKRRYAESRMLNARILNEKGIALVMVLILSAIALAVMAGLIYMITSGTQISGVQKRYKTALEAGLGGADITYQRIAARGNVLTALITPLNLLDSPSSLSCQTNAAATVTLLYGTVTCGQLGSYSGMSTKINLPTVCWSGCDTSMSIDPNTPSSYDMSFNLGTGPVYTTYAKIVDTVFGNSGGDEGLSRYGVVSASGDIMVTSIPYLYTVEIESENTSQPVGSRDRAKLSILYQY